MTKKRQAYAGQLMKPKQHSVPQNSVASRAPSVDSLPDLGANNKWWRLDKNKASSDKAHDSGDDIYNNKNEEEEEEEDEDEEVDQLLSSDVLEPSPPKKTS
ncbi:hypothetical protein K435DRAFT_801068 [Dendrothele bispora CBS 962.96]|uniref:Uncharacterized protein n=1 Tax=Dendrothele bispora (strain CBS 962.96) TaxID=1314807 RepID=A0A4S8LQF5_DENBC|nr:hypothetical protein K435DRAFT_801068 [Dendrothele bispora CBS 962.96]